MGGDSSPVKGDSTTNTEPAPADVKNSTPAKSINKAIDDVAKVAKEAITQATLAMAQSQRCAGTLERVQRICRARPFDNRTALRACTQVGATGGRAYRTPR